MNALRIFSLLLSLATCLQADLVFDANPLLVNPKPEDEEIEATFTFTNNGDKPVTITGLESTCACLEASLDKRVYAPGEKGSGKARFKVSSFVGKHEKSLHIYTDNPLEPDKVLTAIIDVPEVIEIKPNNLQWAVGSTPEAKTYVIKMLGTDEMHITNITATRQNVTFEKKEITPGREYQIILKPTSTAEVTIGALKIETDSKIPKYARQMAFFSIVKPEQLEKESK
ncbi:MAG: hypothetical protein RL693_1532 [Verrucomicrobiota bacterium]|jgi:hypothetical protein